MKKFFILFAFSFCLSLPAYAGSFPDVAEDHLNYEAIEYLEEHGVIDGYKDGTFGPENPVRRSEAMKMVIGAFSIDFTGSYLEVFPDVSEDEWYFSYVMAGHEKGIINGYDDGNFKPDTTVNLAELLKIIVLAGDVDLETDIDDDVFIDVPKSEWYAPHALYARNHNVVLPDDYGYLNADKPMTRSDFAEVVYRMMIVHENNGDPYPLDKNWDLYESDVLPFSMKYDSKSWEVIENYNEIIFFRPDLQYKQFSPAKIYPNTAVLTVTLDSNADSLSASDYFMNIETVFSGGEYNEFSLGELSALEVVFSQERIVDWYIYLENGEVLVIYTEFGDGALGYQLMQILKSMLATLEYRELDIDESLEDFSSLLSEIFGNILVEDTGMEMLEKLPDKLIIETDTIGVGTGPVDYYYSEGVNYTFKYERAFDVILDTREGQTTAF
jgi:hypothetical protein